MIKQNRLRVTNIFLDRFLIFAVPICVVGYFSFLTRNYQVDDALIYLRYIKNYHDGFGLVYNPGERFNGLTSPLFTFISLAVSFLSSNFQGYTIVISAVFLACASILGGKIISKGKWEALFTSVVIGSFGYFYSTFGMETPLLLLLIALSLYLYKADSEYFIVALALLIITRSEGVFLAVVMALDYLIKNRRLPNIKILAFSIVIVLLPFIFNYFYYGELLPATASAKIGQGKSGLWDECCGFLHNAYLLIDTFFSDNKISVLFFLISSAYGVYISLKDRMTVVILFFLVVLLCFYVGLNIPGYHWYYAPFVYLLLIFACHGIWSLSANLLSKGLFNYRTLAFSVLCGATIFAITKVVSFNEKGGLEEYAWIGRWVENNTAPNASIAMVEIGAVGWYSNRKIIDILGLVNKYNADYIGKSDLYGWLSHYQPDYILRHDPNWKTEKSTIILENSGAYVPTKGFNYPNFVLLRKSDKYTDVEIANYFREVSVEIAKSRSFK
jgi:hypothetical protein